MRLVLSHISKYFGKKVALDDISVSMSSGSLYVFTGENGAGKSTLAKIISGKLDYEGEVISDGIFQNDITSKTNITSKPAGLLNVQIVSQTPVVAESITVKENIFLGIKETKENRRQLDENIVRWTEGFDVNSYVKDIGGAARFYTSLMQVFLKPFDVLILDEPGAYLDSEQRRRLFEKLSNLKKENKIIIVISHNKKEIINYADEVILLKKGKMEKHFSDVSKKSEEEKNKIVSEIKASIENVGENNDVTSKSGDNVKTDATSNTRVTSETNITSNTRTSSNSTFSFTVQNLSSRPVNMPLIENISFSVTSGTITLIKGLAESGLLTLEDALTGMQKNKISGIFTFSKNNSRTSVKELSPDFVRNKLSKKLGLKIAVVPSNKILRASNPELTVEQLMMTSSVPLKIKSLDEHISKIIKASGLDIDKTQKVKSLSGGMLQRLILERELSFNPDILIMCEPLAGLDMQKTEIIINKIVEVKNRGGAVLVLSTEDFTHDVFDRRFKLEGGRLC
ncbi:MAG: ATP-binding cassette domain-containing protein [Treponema sp.]|nr:ATP-binding cassette domain-containing protein [Candidatus Treponema scatequi]